MRIFLSTLNVCRALKDAAAVIHESPSALQVKHYFSTMEIFLSFSAEISPNIEFNQRWEEFNDYISVSRGYFWQLDERQARHQEWRLNWCYLIFLSLMEICIDKWRIINGKWNLATPTSKMENSNIFKSLLI